MAKPIGSKRTPWRTVILLCGKCARKLDGGYGEDESESLRAVLRGELRALGRRREVHLVETKCLGLCPKRAVTAINASRPGRLLTVPKGTAPGQALSALIPEFGGEGVAPPRGAGSL